MADWQLPATDSYALAFPATAADKDTTFPVALT
jgi:hypothetical protein